MTWSEYKRLCDRPDHWSRWMLEQSIELLHAVGKPDLIGSLSQALQSTPLPKPEGYRGGPQLDMHRLTCVRALRFEIVRAMVEAKATGLRSSGTMRRGLGGFEEAWREYASFPDRV